MHELSLAESTLALALRHAEKAGADRVTALHLVVGEFTTLEESSLGFYWERVCRGTPAAGSSLNIRRIPARLKCLACNEEYDVEDGTWHCPSCRGERIRMISGDECYLESIEVEETL